jgi:GTP-binding protein
MPRHHIEWECSVYTHDQFPARAWPQVAFAGRSNVGKSSLLNRLFGVRLAKVSQTPGKTRSLNYYRVDEACYAVDLPGYGYARRSKTERARFAALIGVFMEQNPHLAGVVQLIDMRHPPTALDLRVAAYLQNLDAELLWVCTKADKLSRGAGARQRQVIASALGVDAKTLLPFSAVDGRGVGELWSWLTTCIGKARV